MSLSPSVASAQFFGIGTLNFFLVGFSVFDGMYFQSFKPALLLNDFASLGADVSSSSLRSESSSSVSGELDRCASSSSEDSCLFRLAVVLRTLTRESGVLDVVRIEASFAGCFTDSEVDAVAAAMRSAVELRKPTIVLSWSEESEGMSSLAAGRRGWV